MEDEFDEYFDDGSFDDATLQQLDQAESHFNAHVRASSGPKEQVPTQKPHAGSSKWQQQPRPAPVKPVAPTKPMPSTKAAVNGKGKGRAQDDDDMAYDMPSMRFDEAKGVYLAAPSRSSPPLPVPARKSVQRPEPKPRPSTPPRAPPQPAPKVVDSAELAALRARVASLSAELDETKTSLRDAQMAHWGTKGEVSIVRTNLKEIRESSERGLAEAKAREDEWRKKVDELERDLRTMRKAEKTNNAFKRIEESAKKMMGSGAAPGSVSRREASQPPMPQGTPSVLRRSVSRPRIYQRGPPTVNGNQATAASRGSLSRTLSSELMPPPPPRPEFVKGKAPPPAKAFGGFVNSFGDAPRATSRAPSTAPTTNKRARHDRDAGEALSFLPEEPPPSPSHGRGSGARAEDLDMELDPAFGDGVGMELDPVPESQGWNVDDEDEDFPSRDVSSEILGLLFQHSTCLPRLPPPIDTVPPPPVASALAARPTGRPPLLRATSASPAPERDRPSGEVPTLHYLLNLRSPEPPPGWSDLCQGLFACLGDKGPTNMTQEEEDAALMRLVAGIGSTLVQMADLASKAQMWEPLTACVGLLGSLCYLDQLFPSLLLNHRDFEPYFPTLEDGSSRVKCMPLLVSLIQSHGLPADVIAKRSAVKKGAGSGGVMVKAGAARMMSLLQSQQAAWEKEVAETSRVALLAAVLDLVEAMLWDPSEACFSELEFFLSSGNVIASLLHTSQQPMVLRRGVGIVMLLACHPTLFRPIMACPMDDNPASTGASAPGTALVNHLAKLLATKPIVEAGTSSRRDLSIEILTLLSMLSIKHADAPVLFCEAVGLVPVLVRVIARDMQVLMSGDGGPGYLDLASTLTRRVDLATPLLHYLIFFRGPEDDQLRSRIFDMQQSYSGAHSDFIVAFTRLAYAEAPEWLPPEDAGRIDGLTELAHDLLMAVASPEEVDAWYDCVVEGADEDEEPERPDETFAE